MRRFPILAVLLPCLIWLGPVVAQAQATKTSPVWLSIGRLLSPIAVTDTSAATALPSGGSVAWICNVGATDAYLKFGDSGATAVAGTSSWLRASTCGPYDLQPNGASGLTYSYVAAVTASSTTSLEVETGVGSPPSFAAAGFSAVTQDTIPWVESVHYWGSGDTALGAPSNYGTSPGAVEVPGVNAFVTNLPSYNYTYVAAGMATTVIKASAGILHSITFNSAATATDVTTLYDNATGTGSVIGIPMATAVVAPVTVLYDIAFANGLTIITTVANGADMTVSFK